jgi:crotonobetainyl-CoA:carnitine CoA-transferase CaiB-like acyl-CoA transferase
MTARVPSPAPLDGLKVVEFTHMVMGPAVGAILAELGADVVKVEPVGGDSTRQLLGAGAGYFTTSSSRISARARWKSWVSATRPWRPTTGG